MAAHNPQVGVRYCGGCNPRYDRVTVIKRFESEFPDVSFVSAVSGVRYTSVLVVCGCTSRCASVVDLAVSGEGLIYLSGWDDLLPSKTRLEQAIQPSEVQCLDHDAVMALLPHRDPILLIDTVSRLVAGKEITASFLVRPELPVLQGHFPDQPVFPGIYTIEAAAQAADLLLLSQPRYTGKTPLFMGVRKANFRKKICPGDVLELRVELIEERTEMGIATYQGKVFTSGDLAADMELTLAMR